jgi:hypothetical protein
MCSLGSVRGSLKLFGNDSKDRRGSTRVANVRVADLQFLDSGPITGHTEMIPGSEKLTPETTPLTLAALRSLWGAGRSNP